MMKSVIRIILIFLVCSGSAVSTRTFQDVIPAVYHSYHRSCVILLFSSQDGILGYDVVSAVMRATLTLQERDVQVTSVPVQQLSELQEIEVCPRKPPLLVVLSADNVTRTFLEEMSTTGKLHRPSWLLFLPDATPLEEFFADIYVPFNCKFLVARSFRDHVTLTEVYRVDQDSSLNTTPFGNWSAAIGLTWCRCSLYNRRKQLNGHSIRAAVVHEPPFTDVREKDGGVLDVGGYFGVVWGLLETRINFTTTWRKPSDGSWGMFENGSWSVLGRDILNETHRHGSWNGMIGMIQRQEVEVAINEFAMTNLRLDVVDFTVPLLATKYTVMIKAPSQDELDWTSFMSPFSSGLWFTLFSTILVIAVYLSALHHLGKRIGNQEIETPERLCLKETFLYVLGAFCQQGCYSPPRSLSCRTVHMTTYLTAVIVLSAYSAALISFLAKQKIVPPFTDLEGMIQDGQFEFEVLNNSAELSYFKDSTNSLLQEVYSKYLLPNKHNLPRSTLNGLVRLCRKDKYAFFTSAFHSVGHLKSLDCKIIRPISMNYASFLGIVISKSSPYLRVINYHLHKLRDNGALDRLRVLLLPQNAPTVRSAWTEVTLTNIAPILVLLASGLLISLACLVVEMRRKASYGVARHRRIE